MNPTMRLVLASLLLLAPAAVAQVPASFTPQPSITLPAELERVLRDYERTWQASEAAGLAALFTADGFVPTPRGWVRGTAAIQAEYAHAGGPLRLRALAFATADTVGYIVGGYRYGDQATQDGGKFVLALRRRPGGPWLIAADLDSGNRP